MDEELKFGKGAIKDSPDTRDFKFSQIAGSLPPFNWNLGYDVEVEIGRKLTVKDQNGSSSCGGQAWSSYGEVIDPDHEDKSAKFIYAQTHVQGGGSGGRENCDLVVKKGWGDEDKTPSYINGIPQGETFYERKEDITYQAFQDALIDKALSFATVTINIDSIALAIRENKGCVIGITGRNNGTWTTKFPLKPTVLDNQTWNHWVFCSGAVLINGKKYLKILNSWGKSVGENGFQYISEDYTVYPFIWSCWTLVYNFPKPQLYQFTKTMRIGNRGKEIVELQRRLNILPFDGIFGKLTKAAVIAFQLSKGLVPDGIVGVKTRTELNK